MRPTLTWLDLTASDRDRMRKVLDLFTEQGTLDEMGLGSLRDAIADSLFPGTSTLHTRLRYTLFIAWIYKQLERNGIPANAFAERARHAELELIRPLSESDDSEGVIGARAGLSLGRVPSIVYWATLVRWGIFAKPRSQSWYHTNFNEARARSEGVGRADDPGVVWAQERNWNPRLPAAPPGFPYELSFDLTKPEAEFLRGQIQDRCSGSLLEWLAGEGSTNPAGLIWEDPDVIRAPKAVTEAVERARRFSLHVEGAPLLYNLLLAERRYEKESVEDDAGLIERYRSELIRWATEEEREDPFDPDQLWVFMAARGAKLPEPQRRFLESWSRRVLEAGTNIWDDDAARRLVVRREIALKGPRARMTNESRLLEWGGESGVGRMEFRWPQVRGMVIDLHKGLSR